MWRRWLILIVALAIAPQVWLRDPPYHHNPDQAVAITSLPGVPVNLGPFTLTGAWQLTSANSNFGGYSALVVPRPGWLRAYSDLGQMLDLPQPGTRGLVRQAALFGRDVEPKAARDVEAASLDPLSGTTWLALEGRNALLRLDRRQRPDPAGFIQPAPMRDWTVNSGPEAMVRLHDGRLLILAEAYASWRANGAHPALRLSPGAAGQPGGAEPFTFVGRAGYRPTDMAQLPDGRVLVLLRRLRWPMPPRFGTWLVLADPAAIAPGQPWHSVPLASLDGTGLEENYEGLAIDPAADGRVTVWLISDANGAVTQRTLLLRLSLDPRRLPGSQAKQKAPG